MKVLLFIVGLIMTSPALAKETQWWFDSPEFYQEWDALEQATCNRELNQNEWETIVTWRRKIYLANYELLVSTLADTIELQTTVNQIAKDGQGTQAYFLAETIDKTLLPPVITHLSGEITRLGQREPELETNLPRGKARQRCHKVLNEAKHETQSIHSLIRIELESIEEILVEYHNAVFRDQLRTKYSAATAPASP